MLISGGTKAKGEQKDLLVADLNGDYQMLLVTFISLGLVLSSLCHISLLWYLFHGVKVM